VRRRLRLRQRAARAADGLDRAAPCVDAAQEIVIHALVGVDDEDVAVHVDREAARIEEGRGRWTAVTDVKPARDGIETEILVTCAAAAAARGHDDERGGR